MCLWPACETICDVGEHHSIDKLAAHVDTYGRTCLKLARLNMTVLATVLTGFFQDKFKSNMIPRYLKSVRTFSFSSLTKTPGWWVFVPDLHGKTTTEQRQSQFCLGSNVKMNYVKNILWWWWWLPLLLMGFFPFIQIQPNTSRGHDIPTSFSNRLLNLSLVLISKY